MSLRILICSLAVVGFSIYAWRNWFVSLCALIILMAFLQHPDMPHSIAGIQGLNPWNVLMLNVALAWYRNRRGEGPRWDMPRYITVLLAGYFAVVVWSFLRLSFDYESLDALNQSEFTTEPIHYTLRWITSDYLINCVKYVLPGFLIFDACRTRHRTLVSLVVLLSLYFLMAVQVVQHMPIGYVAVSGSELARKAAKVLHSCLGYFRTEVSMMLAGASWAILCTVILVRKTRYQLLLIGAAALVALGQALTGGRAGYVTWGLTGLVLCAVRWRRLLLCLPLFIVFVAALMPGVTERMLQGFGSTQGNIVTHTDDYSISSGRTLAWTYVIPKIWESPVFGYGRQAMIRTGIYQKILEENDEGETFPHPHNAYLEVLLDDGLVGFLLVMPFYVVVLVQSLRLFADRSDPLFGAVGGASCALILGLLFASIGSQSFYPKESSVGMCVAIGVMLRVFVERRRAIETGEPLFGEGDDDWRLRTEERSQQVGDQMEEAQPVMVQV